VQHVCQVQHLQHHNRRQAGSTFCNQMRAWLRLGISTFMLCSTSARCSTCSTATESSQAVHSEIKCVPG
jgi:hypothetical protein